MAHACSRHRPVGRKPRQYEAAIGRIVESLNVQGAYFEVLSDMLGSLGVIVAALVIMYTGWTLF